MVPADVTAALSKPVGLVWTVFTVVHVVERVGIGHEIHRTELDVQVANTAVQISRHFHCASRNLQSDIYHEKIIKDAKMV
jgi:hypothetical protein